MVQLTARVNAGATDRLRRDLRKATNEALRGERSARSAAAKTATAVTRATFQYKRPGHAVPERKGRTASSGGKFTHALTWKPVAGQGLVAFDIAEANAHARYWIIQELGTDTSATLKHAEAKNPRGRPITGADYVVEIPKQAGRFLSTALGWASGPGGILTAPGAGTGQQLYLIADLIGPRGGKARRQRNRKLRIKHEITGQHMVREGARKGFREYRESVLAAAQHAFGGQGA